MNKVMAKGIMQTQPSFSFMQNETTGMAICKGFMSNSKSDDGNIMSLICFDDLAYFMRNNFNSTDKVEVHGYYKNYKAKLSEKNLEKIFVVTELIDRAGNVIRNEAEVEEKACEEMIEKGFSLVDIYSSYFI